MDMLLLSTQSLSSGESPIFLFVVHQPAEQSPDRVLLHLVRLYLIELAGRGDNVGAVEEMMCLV